MKSAFFTISNGVRQGGILCPRLFSVYMNDLSIMLIKSGLGCPINNTCVNRVFYADDFFNVHIFNQKHNTIYNTCIASLSIYDGLFIMAPCAIALQ